MKNLRIASLEKDYHGKIKLYKGDKNDKKNKRV